MKITDKIDTGNSIRDDAVQGGNSGGDLPRLHKKAAPEAAPPNEAAPADEADFFTISNDLSLVLSSLSGKAAMPRPEKAGDSEMLAFVRGFLKERAAGADLADESAAQEDGLISGETNLLLKSLVTASSARPEISIPQGTGMSGFLIALLNEILPGHGIRLHRVYRRKRKAGQKGGKEEEEKEAPGKNNSPLKEYHAGRIAISVPGLIWTSDGVDLSFSLGLDAAAGPDFAGVEAIRLDPLTIRYGGPASDLDDARFAFDSGNFSGGAGSLTIELVETGRAGDGSVIYGVPDGSWIEE